MTESNSEEPKRTGRYHCDLDQAADDFGKGVNREESLNLICEQCYPDLEKFFAGRGVPRGDAEELIHETLKTVIETLDQFRGDACVRTWINQIAKNKLYREWGKGQKQKQVLMSSDDLSYEPEEPSLSPEEETERRELSELVRQEVLNLPPRMRACVELKLYQDRSYKEIAEILGVKIGTVGVTLMNAVERLKKVLGERIRIDVVDFKEKE